MAQAQFDFNNRKERSHDNPGDEIQIEDKDQEE